jgi:ribosomal protein S18 acetylase RimI-like enzyme
MSKIVEYENSRHRAAVVDLWSTVFGYASARNRPSLVIDKKLGEEDGLFFVAEDRAGVVIGSVMGGYDGHRGWIYSLAVAPARQRGGIGGALMEHVEKALADRGCVKINLQILEGNAGVVAFYEKLGFVAEPRISMGKTLGGNLP